MKYKIPILVALMALTSCFNQSKDGCPADMYLTFSVEDPYEPDTYDSRLGNDVMLYIFKAGKLESGTLIPYEEISGGQEYVIRKNDSYSGALDLVAWAVPAGSETSSIPQLSTGDDLYDIYCQLDPVTRAEIDCMPTSCHLHVARITSMEAVDRQTRHNLGLNYSDCRMEVRVTDHDNALSQTGSDPKVCVYGTMTQMDMDRKGVGNAAAVHTPLDNPTGDNRNYTTGRFGLMPSSEGQTVSVAISDGTKVLATLDAPQSALPEGAVSGGLIIFEYTLDSPEFTIEVNGFRQVVYIVDDM